MRRSIKKQLILLITALVLGTLALCWLFSRIFLTTYYQNKKEGTMVSVYTEIKKNLEEADYEANSLTDNSAVIDDLCERNNISVLVIQVIDGRVYRSYQNKNNVEMLDKRLLYEMIMGLDESFYTIPLEKDFVSAADDYIMYILHMDKHSWGVPGDEGESTKYLELMARFDQNENFYIAMQTPIESIEEYASVTYEFLLIIGFAGLVLSIIIVWLVASKAAKPILELVSISKRMSELDFEAKYTSGGRNEIGLLGQHFNQMSETLENTISELKTANNELQKDIEQKIQVDEMRKEFLSNVSHELKTPIALIQGYAEGLKECINDDEESREFYCEVIMDEASKMNKMVKKLLSLNQLEFGNEKVVMERFDLTDLVSGVIQSADILVKQKGAQVLFEETEPLYVWGDEFKIEEVITNYFSNALNHVANEMKIAVRFIRKDDLIRVSIFNTGAQIPEEDIDNIWIKFYKVDKARTREYGGNGIGLSIVKAIMESMNKEYGVNNYTNGVEFWFELDADVS